MSRVERNKRHYEKKTNSPVEHQRYTLAELRKEGLAAFRDGGGMDPRILDLAIGYRIPRDAG